MESHPSTVRQKLIVSGAFGLYGVASAWLATVPMIEALRLYYWLLELEPVDSLLPAAEPPKLASAYFLVRWTYYIYREYLVWRRAVLPHWKAITFLGLYYASDSTGFMYHSGIPAFANHTSRGAEFGLGFWTLQRITDGEVFGFYTLMPYPRTWPSRRRHCAHALTYATWGAVMGYLYAHPFFGFGTTRGRLF